MNRLTSPAANSAAQAAPRPYYLGLDGCRGGWAAARIVSFEKPVLISIAPDLEALRESLTLAARVFIDIPLGLKTRGTAERVCDIEARKVLASRKSSVFRVPVRPAVYADTYRKALSLQRKQTGSGISIQCWNITAKIREADTYLRQAKTGQSSIYESHPELCFSVLKGETLSFTKKTAEGISERIRILSKWLPDLERSIHGALAASGRGRCRADDLLDACALSVCALLSAANGIKLLPEKAPLDRCGLPMRIAYPALGKGRSR